MLKNKRIGLIILVLTFFGVVSYVEFSKDSIVYFDYNEVYNHCEMKKDLEKELERVTNIRRSTLDSMQLQLKFLSNQLNSDESNSSKLSDFEDLKNVFMNMEQQYKEENMRLKDSYFNQIKSHISERIKIFAEQEGYDIVLTLSNDGSLLYGNDNKDITKDFQAFIDNK